MLRDDDWLFFCAFFSYALYDTADAGCICTYLDGCRLVEYDGFYKYLLSFWRNYWGRQASDGASDGL
jgi:hypothetical protein